MDSNDVADEVLFLKASFDSSEFCHIVSAQSHILKFSLQKNVSVTFELPPSYPLQPPSVSISAAELTNSTRSSFENELRSLASESKGRPMIMDLVIRLQQLMSEREPVQESNIKGQGEVMSLFEEEETYLAVTLIDHIRRRKKYCHSLESWASELYVSGCLLFHQKWIFLFLQGFKKSVKEFMTRHRTVCIDVDSSVRPCKEKMTKILLEGHHPRGFSTFSTKESTSVEALRKMLADSKMTSVYEKVLLPVVSRNS